MRKALGLLTMLPLIFSSYGYAEITFNGFASIVGGQTTSDDETLYGFDNDLDFKNGSLMALQASSDLGEGLSVTAQIMSRGADDWDPEFAWAYVAYDINDNVRVLAGRQRAPFYMYSDYLDVSYAYPWISPPKGVYDLVFDSFDGLGLLYTTTLGEFDVATHLIYGSNDDSISIGGENSNPDFQNLFGGSLTFTRDWLTLRVAHLMADISIPYSATAPLVQGWQAYGFNDIADSLLIDDDKATFTEVGFQIDYNTYLLIGEYTQLRIDDTFLTDDDSYFITAGKRFDNVLLTVTYGKDDGDPQHLTSAIPSGTPLDALKIPTDGVTYSQKEDQSYTTLGLRWDFHSSAALKFEYTAYSDELNDNNDVDLIKVALVTVF